MRKIIVGGLTIASLIALGFCGVSNAEPCPATVLKEVNVEGRYSMMLPDYLKPGSDLNTEASLQYQNPYNEIYIIVIDESKDDFKKTFIENGDYDFSKGILVNYTSVQMESIKSNLSSVISENLRTLETGAGTAIVYDVTGTQDGIEEQMGFSVEFVEGKLNLYMIMTWCFALEKSKYQADMDAMLSSFKELSGAVSKNIVNIAINVPPYMNFDSTYALAKLCYVSEEKQLHVAAYEEGFFHWDSLYEMNEVRNQSLLDYYTQQQIADAKSGLKVFKSATEPVKLRINGMDAQMMIVYGQPSNSATEMFYKMCCYHGTKGLYLVQTWTPTSKRVVNEELMNEILLSFHEQHLPAGD